VNTNTEPKDQPPDDIECHCPMCDVAAAKAWADLDYSWIPLNRCKRHQHYLARLKERQRLEKKPGPAAPAPGGSPPGPTWPAPPIDDAWLSSIL
jgi:hypothetical protein